ncbi:Rieske 2Fe-2S domain-containing protein [Pedobacter sp. P351]|uniref:Rieske (2Fe-2S) protein n=1 Tax=Pedobacter superstes TaxID=3133441 RepID=UPI0030A33FF2
MKWFKVFDSEIVQHSDFIIAITVNGKKLCAIKSGDNFFFTQPYCPHAGAGLSGGWCKDDKLICPFHRYEYDLKTGRGAPGQGDYIDIHPSEIRPDGVYVGLPEGFNLFKMLFK